MKPKPDWEVWYEKKLVHRIVFWILAAAAFLLAVEILHNVVVSLGGTA